MSSAYRSGLHHSLNGKVPPEVVRTASSSIGVAEQTAHTLSPPVASMVTSAANHAFVSAITRGFVVSAVVIVVASVVAATMIPRRMRAAQFDDADDEAAASSTRAA